jgi:hypothetical protein
VTRALELASAATERTTAATDAVLALTVCAGIGWLRRSTPDSWRRSIWLLALAAFGGSATLGAVAHGIALAAPVRDALFDHNGLFHLVQLAGVLLLIRGLGPSLQPVRASGA